MKSTQRSSRKTSTKASAKGAAAQVRAYLASLPAESRRALEELRAAIRAAAPDATEEFAYRMPAFRLEGRPLVYCAAFKQHTGLYPMTESIRQAHAADLEGYETSKGTVRFPLGTPVPAALVEKLVRTRIAEMRTARSAGRKKPASR